MSATYNWAYRPGVPNKYGAGISAGADNVRPANAYYVALFGNDVTGNGSRQSPYRTVGRIFTLINDYNQYYVIIAAGVYREQIPITIGERFMQVNFYGDGDVTLDFSYYNSFFTTNINGTRFYNIRFRGAGNGYLGGSGFGQLADIIFTGCVPARTNFGSVTDGSSDFAISGCTISNANRPFLLNVNTNGCTVYQCNNVVLLDNISACVFSRCNITVGLGLSAFPRYCLFYQCNFRFANSTDNSLLGGLYPDTPSGFTYYADMAALVAAYSAANPGVVNPFLNCIMADPKFNNAAIGDFTLAFDSPAKNASYFGAHIGASSIAYALAAESGAGGSFDPDSKVNLDLGDNSITLTDSSQPGQIDSVVIVNLLARELFRFPIYGFSADRNGQYIDSIADLSASVLAAGDTLAAATPYLAETAALTYNGTVYQPGERLTTVSGVTVFSTAAGGTLREILEAPQRHTIMARFSDGGAAVVAGDALTDGAWYFVSTGSVTYNTVSYAAGKVFKAAGTGPFTGSGTVIVAMSAESFQHYEPGIKPTTNNGGDSRTGSILRGNGDPAYVRGGLGVTEFPVNAKFIQLRYIIKINNLKP